MEAQIRKSILNATPFAGSDATWKFHHGNNWKAKKQEYLNLCQESKAKLKAIIK